MQERVVYVRIEQKEPKGIKRVERPMRYCQMVLSATYFGRD